MSVDILEAKHTLCCDLYLNFTMIFCTFESYFYFCLMAHEQQSQK